VTARDDLDALQRRQDRRMDRWRRQLRDEFMAAYRQRTAGRETVDTLAYALLRMDIERIYSAAYARWPGDVNAPLSRIIRGDTLHARVLAWLRSRQLAERFLPVGLVRAIRAAL
jgi:hypothetical protein